MFRRAERYRSGHNEAVLKTVCLHGHMGSNPILSVLQKQPDIFWFNHGEVPKRLKGLPWKGSRRLVPVHGFKSHLLRLRKAADRIRFCCFSHDWNPRKNYILCLIIRGKHKRKKIKKISRKYARQIKLLLLSYLILNRPYHFCLIHLKDLLNRRLSPLENGNP